MRQRFLFLMFLSLLIFGVNPAAAQMSKEEAATVKIYEGFPPMPFEAPDLDGNKQFLPDYKGKTVILHFWDTNSKDAASQLVALNQIGKDFPESEVAVLGMADNSKEDASAFLADKTINFPMIVDVLELSNMAYGGDKLNNPRTFIIDEFGIIQKVLLNTGGEKETYNKIKEVIHSLRQ